jgi:prepilin-type N-terminal cleavage/methylation domain-containing protein
MDRLGVGIETHPSMETLGMKRTSALPHLSRQGFTLMELLVGMVISLVLMGAILSTFKSQQDSYVVQEQVAEIQQNLRAAMYLMSSDIQMGGYYTSFDSKSYSLAWDPTFGTQTLRPMVFGRNNDTTSANVLDGTDVIVIVKASSEKRLLLSGEGNSGSSRVVTMTNLNLDGVSGDDLDSSSHRYGVLVKSDLTKAEFFYIDSSTATQLTLDSAYALNETYSGVSDVMARADIIVYKVNPGTAPTLQRENLGTGGGFQDVAENITDMQISYVLANGTTTASPTTTDQANIREVVLTLSSGVTRPPYGYINRSLTSTIKVRNLGL